MKLFHKIFLCFVVLFGIAFQVTGCLLVNFVYKNAIDQEKKYAFQEFQHNKYILQSILYLQPELFVENQDNMNLIKNFTVPIAFYKTDGQCVFSNISIQPQMTMPEKSENHKIEFQMLSGKGENYIYTSEYVRQGNTEGYLVTETNISATVNRQKDVIRYLQKIYMVLFFISFPLIILMTDLIASPIRKVGKATRRIAEGRYSERICIKGKDEISELAFDFNQMAGQIEKKISELSNATKAKEEFTANFAHELKTPLTSVIGYADMLYQRELPRNQVRDAAEYILNEGMRLEALSLKLMDLFILDRQDFLLEGLSVKELFENLKQSMQPICSKYGTRLHEDIEDGYIDVDYDLIKTMILNLIDNSGKAESKDIWFTGKKRKNSYFVCIKDNGRGIPSDEIDRITEAFYMVDKSRSRKQHGAGLGLALVSKIVEIHKAKMKIESDGKSGTIVKIKFHLSEGESNDQKI